MPQQLNPSEPVHDTVHGSFDQLYSFNVDDSVLNIGALMSNIYPNEDGVDSTKSVMMIKKGQPPFANDYDCINHGFFTTIKDKHCVLENEGGGIWYVVIAGDRDESGESDLSFSLTSFTKNHVEERIKFSAGEKYLMNAEAATTQYYRVPKGPEGTFFYLDLIEHDDIDFNLDIRENLNDESYACKIWVSYRDHWHNCRLANNGEGYWYIRVRGAAAGSYTLWTETQNPINLLAGESVTDQIETDNFNFGQIYRIPTVPNSQIFTVNVIDKSDLVGFDVTADVAPTNHWSHCRPDYRSFDTQCVFTQRKASDFWYVLVRAEAGTTYTLNTLIE